MIRTRSYSVLPGFGITMGYTLTYLGLIVLIPLAALILRATSMSFEEFCSAAFNPRVLASYRITFGTSLAAALVNSIFGFIVAWCLVRYRFPGRRFLDALIDLPFAIPTSVSGIALTAIYDKNGLIGQTLHQLGIQSAYSSLGICIALTFISLPFVVRTLQPALEELDGEYEEAAMCLGASRWETFVRVILPALLPALLTGFALAFARSLGEYGSVVFISGNLPMKTEITSLLIISKFEQHDMLGATAIAVVMLVASFTILMSINGLQWYIAKRFRG
jgi:sulfate transport system permease protein